MLKVMAIGNLGRDVDLRFTGNGVAVASFSIAVTERYKDKQGNQHETTEWVNCVCWDKLGQLAADYLKKGSKVYIEGKLKTSKYTDNNGVEKYKTDVVVKDLEFLTPRSQDSSEGTTPMSGTGEDQVPF